MFDQLNELKTRKVSGTSTKQFLDEVLTGLRRTPRHLPSKYFYDAAGDKLFQQIMASDEYYLTRSETEIFAERTDAIVELLKKQLDQFLLIELGPGDISKSVHLIEALHAQQVKFRYVPIDISKNIIDYLNVYVPERFEGVGMHALNGEYFEMLKLVQKLAPNIPKVILCLGGNMANMLPAETRTFCDGLRQNMTAGDLLISGFDLQKHPRIIRAAYNDKAGITAAFNLNLLRRMNRELGTDFDPSKFEHYCSYDPQSGACKSFLVCLEAMSVQVGEEVFEFKKGESIWTEISQKYSVDDISLMAVDSGFAILENIYDGKKWFVDSVWIAE